MTISNLPKSVRFFPQERLELIDINALQSLARDLIANETLCTMGDTTYGWVVQGFNAAAPLGLTFNFDVTIPAVAIDSSGRLLISPTSSALSFTAPADGTYYLYAYVVDAADNLDNRMKWDSTTASEVSINDQTRYTPVVGIHGSTTGSLTSLSLLGVTVPLVSLWEVVFVGGNLTGSTDLRSPLRAVNLIDSEVITARSSLKAGGGTATTLQNRIEQARAPSMVVGDSAFSPASQGEYDGESGLRSALSNVTDGGGLTYIKYGHYPLAGDVILGVGAGASGWKLIGDPPPAYPGLPPVGFNDFSTVIGMDTASAAVLKFFSFYQVNGVVVEDIRFEFTGAANAWYFDMDQANKVVFRNCSFINRAGCTKTEPMFKFHNVCGDITFDNCRFYSEDTNQPIFSLDDPTADSNFLEGLTVKNCWFTVNHNILLAQNEFVNFTGHFHNNRIYCGSTVNAYSLFYGLTDTAPTSYFTFKNNTVYLAEANTSFASVVNFTTQTPALVTHILNVDISYNEIIDQPGTSGDIFLFTALNALSRCNSNTVNATALPMGSGITFYHFGGFGGALAGSTGAEIKDNFLGLNGGGTTTGISVIPAAGASLSGPGGDGLYITGNVIRDAVFGVKVGPSVTADGLFILDNSFDRVLTSAISIDTTSVAVANGFNNVLIEKNVVSSGGTQGAVFPSPGATYRLNGVSTRPAIIVSGPEGVSNLSIKNNMIQSWANTGTALSSYQCIHVHLGSFTTIVDISSNQLNSNGDRDDATWVPTTLRRSLCSHISFVPWYQANSTEVLTISDNTVSSSVAYGASIYVDAGVSVAGTGGNGPLLTTIKNNTCVITSLSSPYIAGIMYGTIFYNLSFGNECPSGTENLQVLGNLVSADRVATPDFAQSIVSLGRRDDADNAPVTITAAFDKRVYATFTTISSNHINVTGGGITTWEMAVYATTLTSGANIGGLHRAVAPATLASYYVNSLGADTTVWNNSNVGAGLGSDGLVDPGGTSTVERV